MTNSNFLFPQMLEAITNEIQNRSNEKIQDLKTFTDSKSILDKWFFNSYIPKGKSKEWVNVEELKAYLVKRIEKDTLKKIEKEKTFLESISNAKGLESCTITIEWKKSQMWGMNPRAEAKIMNKAAYFSYFDSGSIGGCGYDKKSTAVANVLNQSLDVLKEMYILRESNLNNDLRTLFGYGAGYGIKPRIEGGVGVSCYPEIFDKLGFNFSQTANGKTFDVFTITKK